MVLVNSWWHRVSIFQQQFLNQICTYWTKHSKQQKGGLSQCWFLVLWGFLAAGREKNKKTYLTEAPSCSAPFSILNIVSVNRWRREAIPPRNIILSIVYHVSYHIISQYIIFCSAPFLFLNIVSVNRWRTTAGERLFHREILMTGHNNDLDQRTEVRFVSIYKIYCKGECRPFIVDNICLSFFSTEKGWTSIILLKVF